MLHQERKRRETLRRRRGMAPAEVEEDRRKLDAARSRKFRKENPGKTRLSFLASGGGANPARKESNKRSRKVHRIKDKLIREHLGEDRYWKFLEKAKEIYAISEGI